MTTQRRPPYPGGAPQRRPTTRRTVPAPTGRTPPSPPPPKKNNLPLILGASGGGLALLILIIAVASSGGSRPHAVPADTGRPAKVEPPKKFVPDVSALEAEGKKKCDDGVRLIQPRLKPDPSAHKERVRADLESGLKLINDGLAAYKKASDLAGKSYALGEYTRARDKAIEAFCTELEKEGQISCDQGLKLIQSTEELMTGVAKLTDEEKKKLKADLEKGVKLITEGMNLFDRSYQVSRHTFDTLQYGKARKAAAMKIGELK